MAAAPSVQVPGKRVRRDGFEREADAEGLEDYGGVVRDYLRAQLELGGDLLRRATGLQKTKHLGLGGPRAGGMTSPSRQSGQKRCGGCEGHGPQPETRVSSRTTATLFGLRTVLPSAAATRDRASALCSSDCRGGDVILPRISRRAKSRCFVF